MFREQLRSFISDKQAKLYIPKNTGLNEYVNGILRDVGVDTEGVFNGADGQQGKLEIIAVRGEDVPQRVADCMGRGEAAYGLTGDDLFDEFKLGTKGSPLVLLNTYDWFDPAAHFNRPALCLLNREGAIPQVAVSVSIAINKKYRLTSERYLAERLGQFGHEFSVSAYAGDTEFTVAEGTHDWCVEVVYTGEKSDNSAIALAGLKIAEIVRFSDISLIGRDSRPPIERSNR